VRPFYRIRLALTPMIMDYAFWDGIYPMVAMHELVVEKVLALLSAPVSLFLILLGAGAMVVIKRGPRP